MALKLRTNFVAIKKKVIGDLASKLQAALSGRVRLAAAVSKEDDIHQNYQNQVDLFTGNKIIDIKATGQYFLKHKSLSSDAEGASVTIYAYLVPLTDQSLPPDVDSDIEELIDGYGEIIRATQLASKEVTDSLKRFFSNTVAMERVFEHFFSTLATLHVLSDIVRTHAPMQAPYSIRRDLFDRAEDKREANGVKPVVNQFTSGQFNDSLISSLLTEEGSRKQRFQFIPSINTLANGFVIDFTYLVSDARITAQPAPGRVNFNQSRLLTISATQEHGQETSDEVVYSFSHTVRLVEIKAACLADAFRTGTINQQVQLVSRGRLLTVNAVTGQNARFVEGIPDEVGVFGELLNAFNMAIPSLDPEKLANTMITADKLKALLCNPKQPLKTLIIEYSFEGDDPANRFCFFICQLSSKLGNERYILNAIPANRKQRADNNVKASAADNHLYSSFFNASISAASNDSYRVLESECTVCTPARIDMAKADVSDESGQIPQKTSCAMLSNRVNADQAPFILRFNFKYPLIDRIPDGLNTDQGLSDIRYGFTKALAMVNNRVSQFLSDDNEYRVKSASNQLAKKVGHMQSLERYLANPQSAPKSGNSSVAQGINAKSIFVFIDKPKTARNNVQGNISIRMASYEQLIATNGWVKYAAFPEDPEGLHTLFRGNGLLAPEVDTILKLREASEEQGETLKPMLFVYFDGTRSQWKKAESLYQDIQNFWPGQQPEDFINIGFLTKDNPLTVFTRQIDLNPRPNIYFEYRLPSNPDAVYIKFDFKTHSRFLAKPYRLTKLGHSPRMLDLLTQGLAATALRQAVIENDRLPLSDHAIVHMIDNCTDILTSLARLDEPTTQALVDTICAETQTSSRLVPLAKALRAMTGTDNLDTLARQLIAIVYMDLLDDPQGLSAITEDLLELVKDHLRAPYEDNLFSRALMRYAEFHQGYVPMSVVM